MIRAAAACALALAAAGCATPTLIDREALARAHSRPALVTGAQGYLSRERSRQVLDQLKARAPDAGRFERQLALEEAVAGAPLSVSNKATLLQDGPVTYKSMLEAIEGARSHVLLEMYIFEADEVGQRFADALIAKRRQGVPVSLLIDGVGSIKAPEEFFQRMKDAGVRVAVFNPVNPLKAKMGWELNERNHRKLLVVDGRIAFLGGINISSVYSSGYLTLRGSSGQGAKEGEKRPWRDTQVRLEGPVVPELQKTFVEMWAKAEPQPPEVRGTGGAVAAGKEAVRPLAGWADREVNAIHMAYLSAIANAEESVKVTMAYFVPDPETIDTLKAAARRGVDVQLVLPSFTDFWVVFHAGRSHYEELLEAGVKIHERKDRLLHAKAAVIDGTWTTVGSANMDWRSFMHNHELNVVILGPEFGAQMEAAFAADVAQSQPITRESWAARPMKDRLRESAARLWEYWL